MSNDLPRALALTLALLGAAAPAARAQPADLPIPAATTDKYPPGVHVIQTPSGALYADAKGRVLYGMDLRTLLRWAPDPAQYCVDACAQTWEPLLAAGQQPNIAFPAEFGQKALKPGFVSQENAPDWTVISGPQGPQWVYKGWHMVFARRADAKASTAFDGADEKTWNTLKFVPPAPKIDAPQSVKVVVVDGGYALADGEGRVLFTGRCARDCSRWRPLSAGMASGPVGAWSVNTSGDTPQWTYRGKAVFVSQEDDPKQAPPSGRILRP